MSRKLLFTLLILTIPLSYSCRNSTLPETVEAHYIQYRIIYLEPMAGDVPTRILPARMGSWYTDSYVLTKIEGFFNHFSLIQIADQKRKRVTTLLNLFGKKVYYRGEKRELPAGIVAPPRISYRSTGKQTVIGGLSSEQMEVDTGVEKFNIYYTSDFKVRQPNLSTPYGFIDYPLSDFRIQLSYLKMHLTSEKYEVRLIDSDSFTIPDEYEAVSRTFMEEIINRLFTKE
ncbi:MAG: hypothetical protein P1P86_13410 [Bacteroidales bacterium]|nr:hypothetical protein [Bacteroidales bacterium]